MSSAKKASKRRRRNKALPVLGAAGLSLSLVNVASATTDAVVPTQGTKVNQEITLGEEEIADVSLATFYVFDKEIRPSIRLARAGRCASRCAGCRCQAPKSRK
jgi:hypothetical protein